MRQGWQGPHVSNMKRGFRDFLGFRVAVRGFGCLVDEVQEIYLVLAKLQRRFASSRATAAFMPQAKDKGP